MSRRTRRALTGVGVAVAVAVAPILVSHARSAMATPAAVNTDVAIHVSTPVAAPSGGVGSSTAAAAVEAATVLAELPVKGKAAMTGYSRTQFGQAWSDDVEVPGGHNGCDTRSDVLRSNLTQIVIKPGTHGCVPLSGWFVDPYTGRNTHYQRGHAPVIGLDHVVALAAAWETGAQALSPQQRRNLANDPANLQPTLQSTNAQKGKGDFATWRPPNRAYWCTYAQRQIQVKRAYHLWVTRAEHDALAEALQRC